MLILNTIPHETIWGGQKLLPYTKEKKIKKLGHLYSLVSNGKFESKILNGKYKGKFFKQYFDENKEKFNLQKYEKFPFVVALVDASDDLSLQVHPDDKIAQELENADFGKNESWVFLDAPNSKKNFNGCKVKNLEELKQRIEKNEFDKIIDYLHVKKGDYVFVKAGTLHSISAGSLVYEIEENCDLTYRFYDFDRIDSNGKKRELHTEKALKSLDVNLKSIAVDFDEEKKERFYTVKPLKNKESYSNTSNTLECLTIINGNFEIDNIKIQRGTTIILEPDERVELFNSDLIISKPLSS